MTKSKSIDHANSDRAITQTPWRILAIAFVIWFGLSGLRHFLIQTEAWDFGIFDQAVYLISQGLTPFSTLLKFHILGDHAAVIFYPIALFYKLYPSGYWLLLIQSIALVMGAWIVWKLALQATVAPRLATALMVIYLLYPVTFNANLSDFHPETIAVPALLGAVWFARADRLLEFCGCLAIVLSCRDALALNVAAMGLWLIGFEKKRIYGAIALISGVVWFVIATQIIVPGASAGAVSVDRYLFRYAGLGNSYGEIAKNLILNPPLLLKTVFTKANVEYLLLLMLPILWAADPRNWSPLIGALPTLAMNLLAQQGGQRSLNDQYSVPVLPFLMLVAIATLVHPPKWLPKRRVLLIWSLIGFLAMAKYGYFTIYIRHLDTWAASRAAIALIQPNDRVLADARLVPQMSHRVEIDQYGRQLSLAPYDAILLNTKRPWALNKPIPAAELQQLQQTTGLKQTFAQDGIVLLQRR